MERELTVTVCLASYNGEKYIQRQIESIIHQLSPNDELIVSDDGSKDNTIQIVKNMQEQYSNICLVNGPQMGFSCNFGNAASYATKDIILFSDQDDIWIDSKIDTICECFVQNPTATTILHRMATFRGEESIDTNEIPISYHKGVIRNFIKSSYWGCCMAVKREFFVRFLPLRDYCVGHDQLTGLMTEKHGSCYFLDQNLIRHRLHDTNTSNRRTILEMFTFRRELFKDYCMAKSKYKNQKE